MRGTGRCTRRDTKRGKAAVPLFVFLRELLDTMTKKSEIKQKNTTEPWNNVWEP